MKSTRQLLAATALCVLGVAPAFAQGTTFSNGNFGTPTASLSAWTTEGDVMVTGSKNVAALTTASLEYEDDYPLPAGFNNNSGTAAVDFFTAANLAGVSFAALDTAGAGALPGAADEWGQTALLLAAREGQVAVVRQLLRAGAQVEGDDSTLTPLAAAALRGHLPMVQVLLRAGARPDATGRGDQTPLILAIRHQHLPVVRELLAAGANTAVTDRSGDGPLVLAIRQDNLPLLDLLLRQGMDPNRPDADGLTPLYWARQEQRPALAQRLIEAGAKEALIRQALRPSRPYPKEND